MLIAGDEREMPASWMGTAAETIASVSTVQADARLIAGQRTRPATIAAAMTSRR
jgi:hypothetical protein